VGVASFLTTTTLYLEETREGAASMRDFTPVVQMHRNMPDWMQSLLFIGLVRHSMAISISIVASLMVYIALKAKRYELLSPEWVDAMREWPYRRLFSEC